jgi:hypothetical protein
MGISSYDKAKWKLAVATSFPISLLGNLDVPGVLAVNGNLPITNSFFIFRLAQLKFQKTINTPRNLQLLGRNKNS